MKPAYLPRLLAAFLLIASPFTHAGKGDAEEQSWQAASEANVASGYKAYLTEYPKGRYAATARIKLAILGEGKTPGPAIASATKNQASPSAKSGTQKAFPRPTLPFNVSEEVWHAIEQSDYYKNSPEVRGLEVSYREVKTQDLGRMVQTQTSNVVKQTSPLASASPALIEHTSRADITTSNNTLPNPLRTNTGTRTFLVGNFLTLGALDNKGNVLSQIQRIHEIKGSLFPLKTGAELRVSYDLAYIPDRNFDSTHEVTCRIGERLDAATVNPSLSGGAWQLSCRGSTRIAGDIKPLQDDTLLLEQYGQTLEKIGFLDMSSKRWVVPSSSSYAYSWSTSSGTVTATTHSRIEAYTISPRD